MCLFLLCALYLLLYLFVIHQFLDHADYNRRGICKIALFHCLDVSLFIIIDIIDRSK